MQLSYKATMTAGRPGLIFDTGYNDFVSKLAEVAIPFGRLVVKGSSADVVKVPTSGAQITDALDACKGIAAATQAKEGNAANAYSQYDAKDCVSVMKRGRVWVLAEGTWTANSQAFVRHGTTTNGSQLGAFRADADGSPAAATALTGAKFVNSGDASKGEFAIVEFDLV